MCAVVDATARIVARGKGTFFELPWKQLARTRDKYAHHYSDTARSPRSTSLPAWRTPLRERPWPLQGVLGAQHRLIAQQIAPAKAPVALIEAHRCGRLGDLQDRRDGQRRTRADAAG